MTIIFKLLAKFLPIFGHYEISSTVTIFILDFNLQYVLSLYFWLQERGNFGILPHLSGDCAFSEHFGHGHNGKGDNDACK